MEKDQIRRYLMTLTQVNSRGIKVLMWKATLSSVQNKNIWEYIYYVRADTTFWNKAQNAQIKEENKNKLDYIKIKSKKIFICIYRLL